ncbi:sigma-70 family RNA polymerase sigma factor [Marinicella litoralis]|uniref:RNA polymerase sigma factor (TIGR02999 family) n=1 Tax=Marinicella litoralis TaxID=644220 RepID=A0A4V3DGK0_9GAMM|nr:sigma-70 family RNA polymerase sigma factor [Marinicella litoralis]TDR14641.1 RNA polymerase sigma factor (TIGR02999 family) [Marinicella litoralis]
MDQKQLTQLLNTDNRQLSKAQQQQLESVYFQLKKIAHSQKFKVQKHGLNTTALVNEAWIKLNHKDRVFNDRNHFFATSALAMRQILLNQAEKVANRGEDDTQEVEELLVDRTEAIWLIDLEHQLTKMGQYSDRLETVFVYKYFGGMSIEEIANSLEVSPRTIDRCWKKAKLMMSLALEQ